VGGARLIRAAALKRCIDQSDTGERPLRCPVEPDIEMAADESVSCNFPEKFFEEMDHIYQVPEEDSLNVEVKISPNDIDQLHVVPSRWWPRNSVFVQTREAIVWTGSLR
jgi:hypothetical protein